MQRKAVMVLSMLGVSGVVGYLLLNSGKSMLQEWSAKNCEQLVVSAVDTFLPCVKAEQKSSRYLNAPEKQISYFLPYLDDEENEDATMATTEDVFTYELLLAMQAEDEERLSEDLILEPVTPSPVRTDLSLEKLKDPNYLLSKFYTVDSTTTVKEGQLDADVFLAKDMHIDTSTKGPKVLIFHTHSQEAFVDSKKGDASESIVGMGEYLAQQLNAKGIETIHHTGVYDLIDGKLDRSKAYEFSEKGVREILNQYPSIEVVIDLHRDGVREDLHLVTEIDGKQTGRIMFFNGLSRTKSNGDIGYLYNPYIQDNLAFSFQMQMASETMYPGLARRIYLKGYRYSLHMMPKSLLIEAGAQTNTVEEMRNTMEVLSNILYKVLVE